MILRWLSSCGMLFGRGFVAVVLDMPVRVAPPDAIMLLH
jgi:hypothetical protein